MVIAVTMVNVQPGKERDFYNAVKNLENVRDVIHVFGEFDFVVIVEAKDLAELNQTVDKIRGLDGVTKTQTVIGAELE
ncbi:Lrp/AsnC family transcriptional regulator [Archaeoglobus profundus]|uniref:Transcriptional regulator, AsnC family n=1 Tax=Archaeoglobus profundus (strain DSM 5631 / JCM 9629 / NBRC 100127 / Av18) TaxID=572546 RepID=D2RDY9_ARCPA|nr:Lrp/AsnC ligand binding domain-containing protein [Archaeoglobus profundus]ADB58333.1 transcriptional regulator, AsnC family [Archaeoglobus profundus DSM 5631]